MKRPHPNIFSRLSRQQGVAAIEFAIVAVVLMMLMFAIIGFGSIFWMQQRLSQFAGEGARAALYASQRGNGVSDTLVSQAACRHVSTALSASACVAEIVPCAVYGSTARCVEVSLSYPLASWPMTAMATALLRALPSSGSNEWVPETLVAAAAVQIR